MASDTSDFWKGWNEALESLTTRIDALHRLLDSHSRPSDVLLDVQNEITELKTVSVEVAEYGATTD